MDDISYLRYRNVQLETELRIAKEQLAQAQSSTQYLVNCFSGRSTHSQIRPSDLHEHRLDQIAAENDHLRKRRAFTREATQRPILGFDAGSPRPKQRDLQAHLRQLDPSAARPPQTADHSAAEQDQLISIFDDEATPFNTAVGSVQSDSPSVASNSGSSIIDAPIDTPLTPWTPGVKRSSKADEGLNGQPVGLGISFAGVQTRGMYSTSQAHVDHERAPFIPHAAHVEDSNLQASPDTRGLPHGSGSWQPLRPSPSQSQRALIFDVAFADHEHNRLTGNAIYIEDMYEEQREKYWQSLAELNHRHSASEWKKYYDCVARPACLARLAKTKRLSTAPDEPRTSTLAPVTDKMLPRHEDGPIAKEDLDMVKPVVELASSEQRKVTPRYSLDYREDPTETLANYEVASNNTVAYKADLDGPRQLLQQEAVSMDSGKQDTPPERPFIFDSIQEDHTMGEQPMKNDSSPGSNAEEVPTASPDPIAQQLSFVSNKLATNRFGARVTPHAGDRQRAIARRSPPRLSAGPMEATYLFFKPGAADQSLCHTVLVSGILTNTSLSEVVSKIRGGEVVSATFAATAGMRTVPPIETNGVLIVFLGSNRAKAYVDFCRENGVFFFTSSKSAESAKTTVSLISTPTRPLHPQILYQLRERGLTRVLFVIDVERRWSPDAVMAEFVRGNVKLPLESGRDKDGVLFFQFADIRDAAAAWNVVDRNHWFFNDASKGFFPDPCAQPLETLLENHAEEGQIADNPSDNSSTSITIISSSEAQTITSAVADSSDDRASERRSSGASDQEFYDASEGRTSLFGEVLDASFRAAIRTPIDEDVMHEEKAMLAEG